VFVLPQSRVNTCLQDLDEFQSTLVMLGKPGVDLELLQKLMSEFDIDQSGTIDANEFSMIMVSIHLRNIH
jgi:Ca2+-binding EF-hand superfamily protein